MAGKRDVDETIPAATPDEGMSNDDAQAEFEEIVVDGWEEANKEAGRTPLPRDTYMMQVKGYEITSTKKGQPRAIVKCSVVNDSIPEYNGRTVRHGLMLVGGGFGMTLGFAEAIDRKFSGKTKILTKRENGEWFSPWLDTWTGALFLADVDFQKDQSGQPTEFNEIRKAKKVV